MTDIMAVPFDPLPIEKFERIVSACSQHRPWFDDAIWDEPQTRREAVIAHLADAHSNGKIFEVWKDEALLGIILFNELCPFRDVRCHFIFFDGKLSDKEQLCINMMQWAFSQLPVEVLRVAIPTYAGWLLRFSQNTLGFKPEGSRYDLNAFQLWSIVLNWMKPGIRGEMARAMKGALEKYQISPERAFTDKTVRPPSFIARLGGRKYRAMKYKGEWHDSILLSVTTDEFVAFLKNREKRGTNRQATEPSLTA